jgi:hypothetical protein
MEGASQTIHSARGRGYLRGAMAAMRKLAWRLGWLDRIIDPLDGLEISRSAVLQGATTHYVDPRLRPETRQVKAMATAADLLCGPDGTNPLLTRLPLLGTKIRVGAFGGTGTVVAFVQDRRWRGEARFISPTGVRTVLDDLRGAGIAPEASRAAPVGPTERLLEGYHRFLVQDRGLCDAVVAQQETTAPLFMDFLADRHMQLPEVTAREASRTTGSGL